MMSRRPLLLIAALAFCADTQAAERAPSQELGRLFMTPQKRDLLEELRRNNAHMEPEQQLGTVRLDGIVRRSSGKQTIWINGHAYENGAPVTRVDEHSARIISGSRSGVELKVGESATPSTSPESRSKP